MTRVQIPARRKHGEKEMKSIGRILSSNHKTARAEFTEDAMEGMLIAIQRGGRRYIGKIEKIETLKFRGLSGYIYWLDYMERPPRTMTEIFVADEEFERGHLHIGNDYRDIKIRLRVNPLFAHLLVAGMTTAGKTHLMIVLCEELGPLRVPCLVIDSQGEMVNLPEIDPERYIVVEDLRIENLISYMQHKKIVVYNLLGYTKKAKAARVGELLRELILAKERDYQQANENPLLLKLPPIFVMIDEADLFAPNWRKIRMDGGLGEAVGPIVDILERGAKFGLGAIVSTQRITRLDIDVRSQCNSAAVFRLIDAGSIRAIHAIDYIPKEEVNKVKSLEQGHCILAGIIMKRVRRIMVRDIVTKRAKHRDFEKQLGIEEPQPKEHEIRFIQTEEGAIVDEATGEVIHSGLERLSERDKAAFEDAPGDGIVLRSHVSPEEQRLLKKLRQPDDKGDRLIG
jgi:DNA helicase HerA-like ATPase